MMKKWIPFAFSGFVFLEIKMETGRIFPDHGKSAEENSK